jgi:hypothetical protein
MESLRRAAKHRLEASGWSCGRDHDLFTPMILSGYGHRRDRAGSGGYGCDAPRAGRLRCSRTALSARRFRASRRPHSSQSCSTPRIATRGREWSLGRESSGKRRRLRLGRDRRTPVEETFDPKVTACAGAKISASFPRGPNIVGRKRRLPELSMLSSAATRGMWLMPTGSLQRGRTGCGRDTGRGHFNSAGVGSNGEFFSRLFG